MLSSEPIDVVSVSTYDYQKKAFNNDKNMAQITRGATSPPIFICGKIYDRSTTEDALQDAAVALSAKSMLLNLKWVEEVRQGKVLPLYTSEEANIAYTSLTQIPHSHNWQGTLVPADCYFTRHGNNLQDLQKKF